MFLKLKPVSQTVVFVIGITLLLPALQAIAVETSPNIDPDAPFSGQPQGMNPGEILKQREVRKAPDLSVTGPEAKAQAIALVDWAAEASVDQDDLVRRTVAQARENEAIVMALCEHAMGARETDYSRALVTLALIGEMRSKNGVGCLEKIVSLDLPDKGTVVEGEILERTALEILQAKAIDGLAYFGDKQTDEMVLKAVADHPSLIVRAEAIAAFLWNHKDDRDARRQLQKYVRKGEEIYIDRVVRVEGEKAETFNPKLEAYLKAHPEVMPPAPEQLKADDDRLLPAPPDFGNDREGIQK